MNILYSGDANIRDGVIISALSLAKTVSEPLHIYILTASLDLGGKQSAALEQGFAQFLEEHLGKYNRGAKVRIFDISERFCRELPSANIGTRFTPFCMLRLFADEIAELPEKILYLDNDVICRKDPHDFYYQDMCGAEFAGVLDYYGSWFFRQSAPRRDYLNSGVLLLDLGKIRKSSLFKKARAMCVTKKMFMPDQSALNKLCKSKRICARKYNEQRKLKENTVFQHFTTSFRFFPFFHAVSVKPWDIEGMHKRLRLFEYDALLQEYTELKKTYQGGKNEKRQTNSDILFN